MMVSKVSGKTIVVNVCRAADVVRSEVTPMHEMLPHCDDQ